ncbi:5'-methylthioadenosine/adenosylhomocysteine nucleosidase [Oribacterium sp. oral taxon 102]|uniref:5'-methylthioadenosine/adenosylhomocysteine nucleosidase n=1 Tax=Oribacterium sp. oral taxon 102 TaxID=671214 RepID=UPI0015B9E1B3|nr:5'-methylthioadenosine/adenosylhomocysteine nucleosidase [Oribacterium sp. oral taxon 102]NWO20948.1 5'-methylthioadenosine/adenosylhomocysteine nucleosidase [Oribacterium sp. oral taxon 102]
MKIGIIGAMEEELSRLREALSEGTEEERGGLRFFSGKLSGREAVLVRSGIGKVNAGACTQLLIDRFQVDCVINTGIAGSLDPAIDIGDIVISEDAVQYDVDATGFGYALGEIPRVGRLAFPADGRLIAAVEEENRRINREIHTFIGRVCSGDRFVSDAETKDWIRRHFQGRCVEMEGAAIAQVATQNQVPFVIIRAISDKADNSALLDYPSFERQAIAHCVRLTEAVVARFDYA